MGFVIARLLIRLSFLFLIVWSILYFYVFWYKISFNNDLIYKTSGIVHFKIFSEKKYFYFKHTKVYLVDHEVSLYSLYDWECWNIKIWKYSTYKCFDKNNFHNFVYISSKILKFSLFKWKVFSKIHMNCDFQVGCKFVVNKIDFLVYQNNLYYRSFDSYKFLYNLKDFKIVGYLKNSLILYKNGFLYELSWDI